MFPGTSGLEFILIAVVALVVVGPKDLPILLRRLGKWTAKVRNMANEFRASFDEMARQSELDELRQEVEALRSQQYVRPLGPELENHFREIGADLQALPEVSATPPAEVPIMDAETPATTKPRRKPAGTQRPDAKRVAKKAQAAKPKAAKSKPKSTAKASAKRPAPARKAPVRKPARKAKR